MAKTATCQKNPEGRTVYFGTPRVRNATGTEVVITSVMPASGEGLNFEKVWLVPVTEPAGALGTSLNPANEDIVGWHWDERIAAAGAELPPSGPAYDLVMKVDAPHGEGTARGIRVNYSSGGRDYFMDYSLSIRLSAGGGCDEEGWEAPGP